MKHIKHFESFTFIEDMALEVLDIFEDVADEFGIQEFQKPKGSGFFNQEIYPNNSITYDHWMDMMGMNKSLRMKINFKGDKKERYFEVEKYIKETFLKRCQSMGLDIKFGGVALGVVVTLTMNITEKN